MQKKQQIHSSPVHPLIKTEGELPVTLAHEHRKSVPEREPMIKFTCYVQTSKKMYLGFSNKGKMSIYTNTVGGKVNS